MMVGLGAALGRGWDLVGVIQLLLLCSANLEMLLPLVSFALKGKKFDF